MKYLQYFPRRNREIKQANQWGLWDRLQDDWWSGTRWHFTEEEAYQVSVTLTQQFVDRRLPQRVTVIDWQPVITLAEEHVKNLDSGAWIDDDHEHWVYEAVMEAVYGDDVWSWINERLR